MLHVHNSARFTSLILLLLCCHVGGWSQPLLSGCANFNDAALGPASQLLDGRLDFSTTPNNQLFVSDFHPILGNAPNGFDYFDDRYLSAGGDAMTIDFSQLPAHTEFFSFEYMYYVDTLYLAVNGGDTIGIPAGTQNPIDLGNNITLTLDEEINVPSPWHAGIMTIVGDVQQFYLDLGPEAMIDNVCYQLQQNCAIHAISAEYDCTPNGIFYVELNLDTQNTSDSFQVAGNGSNYGTFSYTSLPIRLGPFPGDGQIDYEFVVTDQQNPNCQNFIELGPIDCSTGGPCSISNVRATPSPCTPNEQFNITLDFDYQNIGNNGFLVIGNGNFYGAYDYTSLPITLPVLFDADGTIYQFNIFDLDDPNCINFAQVGPIDCNADCEIDANSFEFEIGDCNPDSSFQISFDFTVSNPGNDFFDVLNGRGETVATYRLAQLPITIDWESNGYNVDTLQVCINDNPDCCYAILFDTPPCVNVCELGVPEVAVLDCANSEFFARIDFEHNRNRTDSFRLTVNNETYGPYAYGDLPVTIGPLPADGQTDFRILNLDQTDPFCFNILEKDPVRCDNCQFYDVAREIVDCANGVHYMELFYQYTDSDSARIEVNGLDYGIFANTDQPIVIGPLPADGQTPIEVAIRDAQKSDCLKTLRFDPVACNNACEIRDLQATFLACLNGGGYGLKIDFEVSNPRNDFFDVYTENGDFVGFYPIADLPVTIPNYPGNGGNTDIVQICINDNPNCCARTEFDVRDCNNNNCEIGPLEAAVIECDNDEFLIRIDFDYANPSSDSFLIAGNGRNYGSFAYDDLPITLEPLPADGTTFYEFVATDKEDPDCRNFIEFGKVECDNSVCEIRDLQATFLACLNGGGYGLKIDFEVSNPGNDFFDVYTENGDFVGFYPLADLPVTIPNYPGNGGNTDIVQVCINDNPNCCARTEFDVRDCNNNNCEIGPLEAEVIECDSGEFFIRINFDYANNDTDTFRLVGNGRDYGVFLYGNLPITLGPLDADGTTFYEFVAIDYDTPDCRNFIEFGKVTCDTDCQAEHEARPIACNPDGSFSVQYYLDFFVDPTDSVSLYFNTPLNFYGTFSLADMPILIPNFPAPNGTTQAKIIAIPKNGNCQVITEFTPLNCASCELFNLQTRVSACDNDDRFDVTIDFDFRNIGNIGFQVIDDQGNNYGPFNYNELPITLENLDANPGDVTRFNIFDILNFNCSLTAEVDHPNCANFCNGFEDLNPGEYLGTDYSESDIVFYVKDVPIYLLPFRYADGSSERRLLRIEEVFNNNILPIRGQTLWAGNSTALFDFSVLADKVSRVTLDITEGHPEYNISVNGEPVQFVSDLFLLSENIAPGVKLQVDELNNTGGVVRLTFTGEIQSLRIGGLESYMDNLCIETEAYADRECIQFEGLPCCLPITPDNTDIGTVIHVENRIPVVYQGGTVWIENQSRCGDFSSSTGNHLFIDGRLELDFTELPETPDEVSFDFSSCATTTSIRFNDQNTFTAIPLLRDTTFSTPSGLSISVQPKSVNSVAGRIQIRGQISGILFSSQGLGIDNICFTNPDGLIVWPGDANNDNIANHFDLLHIGMAFGEQGRNRGSVEDTWTGIFSGEWGQLFGDQETDFMHADCNGDGRIDDEDLLVLEQNYGETHGSFPELIEIPADENDPALFLDMDGMTSIRDGGAIRVPLRLGTNDIPTQGLYGIAFTLRYDPLVIDPNSLELNLQENWLGEIGSEVITIQRHDPQEGRIDIALSRIDQREMSGGGEVASVIGIIDNIAGKVTTEIDIENVKAINAQAQRLPIYTEGGGMEIITSDQTLPLEERLGLFPNPAHRQITISSPAEIRQVQVYNVLGRQMFTDLIDQQKYQFDVADWAPGIYFAQISLKNGGRVIKKFEVIKM